MNAVRPSLVSSDAEDRRRNSSLVIFFNVSSSSYAAASTTLRLARTASGATAQICSASLRRFLDGLAGLDEAIDEAELVGALGRQRLTREDRFHRGRSADRAWQAEQPAGTGDQVALDLGESERRSGGGDDEVGGEHDLASAGGRQAVDGNDHRLLAIAVDEPGESAAFGVRACGLVRQLIAFRSAPAREDRPILRLRCWQ